MPPTAEAAIKTCMATFCGQHKILLGEPYLVQWGKDQKIMKEIIATYSISKTFALIALFFRAVQKDAFLKKTGATVGIFKTQIPKLIMQLQEKKEEQNTGRL